MPNKIGIFIDVNTIGWTLIEQSSKEIIAMGQSMRIYIMELINM